MKTSVICTTVLVENSPQALPLGAACIASAIKNDPRTSNLCNVELICFGPEAGAETVVEKLKKTGAGIVCFSVFVWNRLVLEEAARCLRKSGVICIAGGPEVTANPASFSDFDFLITGPGEEKVPAIIEKVIGGQADGKKAPASAAASSSSSPSQISSLPSPYLDGTLDPTLYGGVLWELARGCPFKCSYCYESKGEKTITRFPKERIEKELELFARRKISQVFVLDPTYNANKKQALELLGLIARKTPDTFYYFEARAEFIDDQMAKAFTKIPCALQIGLQSADENVLRLVNRPFNRKQFLRGINCLNRAGVVFGLDLIYGLPGDTYKGFTQSVDFAIEQYPNNLEIFCLSVLPGTDLSERSGELQLNYQKQAPYHIINSNKFSEADVARAQKLSRAVSVFYNDGRAVPWFLNFCSTIKMKPSQIFAQFADTMESAKTQSEQCLTHQQIEKLQVEFAANLLKQKHLEKYTRLMTDIIRLNGAISRTQDTGKSEKVRLSYPAEYVDSQYAANLQYFLANVKPKQNTITTFRQNNQTWWK